MKKQINIPKRKKMPDPIRRQRPAVSEDDAVREETPSALEEPEENRRIAEDEAVDLEEYSENLDMHRNDVFSSLVPTQEDDESSLRFNFVRPLVDYFKHLEQTLVDELSDPDSFDTEEIEGEFPDVVAQDELQFDELSINAAVTLCRELETYLRSRLSDEQFNDIQSVYLFYESSEQLLDMIKLLFIGDLVAKEKVVRIYGSKVFGTFKVVQMILDTAAIFEGMDETEERNSRKMLQKYAEDPLRQFKKFFFASEQKQIPNTGSGLADGVRNTLASREPLFVKSDDYNKILVNFRKFILSLYADPFVLEYVKWKDRYMRHWLFHELHQLDIQNMKSSEIKIPQYSNIKCKIYQQLDQNFSSLERSNRIFDKSLELRKTHFLAFRNGESFMQGAEEASRMALEKAREHEKALLDSLNSAQINAIAEKIHIEIAEIRRNKKLAGKAPRNVNLRSVDMSSEKKAEKKYMAATAKIQITQSKQRSLPPPPKFLQAMGKIARNLVMRGKSTASPVTEQKTPETHSQPDILPRAEGNLEGPLEKVEVDWTGYGKEFKTTVYERTFPNLQERFFEHGQFQLRLNQHFIEASDAILEYYKDLGYLQSTRHKIAISSESGDGVKAFVDEAIYLRISAEMFLALGRAPFSKNAEPTHYLQIYQNKPIRVKKGALKNIDFSRMAEGLRYELEDTENAVVLRPLLFKSLIKIIDSLPDQIRNQHQAFLKGMVRFLESDHAAQSTS
ncbi:MAG: hypothetical protein HQM13_02160 [SAR324 cluster bacterium]|nr:hypothetical protein [SAR324 cluster bacterium]